MWSIYSDAWMKLRVVHQLIICGRIAFGIRLPATEYSQVGCTCRIFVVCDFFPHIFKWTYLECVCVWLAGFFGLLSMVVQVEQFYICMLTAKLMLHKHQFAIQFLSKTFAILLWLVWRFGHRGIEYYTYTHTRAPHRIERPYIYI